MGVVMMRETDKMWEIVVVKNVGRGRGKRKWECVPIVESVWRVLGANSEEPASFFLWITHFLFNFPQTISFLLMKCFSCYDASLGSIRGKDELCGGGVKKWTSNRKIRLEEGQSENKENKNKDVAKADHGEEGEKEDGDEVGASVDDYWQKAETIVLIIQIGVGGRKRERRRWWQCWGRRKIVIEMEKWVEMNNFVNIWDCGRGRLRAMTEEIDYKKYVDEKTFILSYCVSLW